MGRLNEVVLTGIVDEEKRELVKVSANGLAANIPLVNTNPLTGENTLLAGGKTYGLLPSAGVVAQRDVVSASKGKLLTNWAGATVTQNGTPASGTAGVVNLDIAPDANAAATAVRLIGDASIRATVTAPISPLGTGIDFSGIAFYVKVKGRSQPVQMTQIYLGATADPFTGKALATTVGVPADGKWHLLFVPKGALSVINSFVQGTDTIASIGMRDRQSAGIGYTGMLSNAEEMQIGPVYASPYSRPKFLIRMDDSLSDVLYPNTSVTFTADGITKSWSHLDLMRQYGFEGKGSCFHLTRRLGTQNARQKFLTASDLSTLAALGWSHCAQTHQDPVNAGNQGLLLMGPIGFAAQAVASVDASANSITTSAAHNIVLGSTNPYWGYPIVFTGTDLPAPLTVGTVYWASGLTTTSIELYPTEADAVARTNVIDLTTTGTPANFTFRYAYSSNDTLTMQADLQNCINALTALGYKDTATIWAPNQGAMDENTRAAALAAGITMTLGIGRTGVNGTVFDAPSTRLVIAETTGGVGFSKVLDPALTVPSAVQTDGAPTAQNARDYVNAVIRTGGIGSNYHHAITASNGVVLAAYLDELRKRSQEGACDVVTAKELADYISASKSMTTAVIY